MRHARSLPPTLSHLRPRGSWRTLGSPVTALLAMAVLAACNAPTPPPTDRPPEPQATQLRDGIQAPLERARAVEGDVQDAADRQRAAIDAAGG